jgi:DNA polymerase-1
MGDLFKNNYGTDMSDDKKLFLLDGMALAYRGHFALIRSPRMTSQGMNTSAVFAFANTLLSIFDREEPTHIAAVFDTPEPTHRHKMFAEYKAQRDAMPEDLSQALPYVFQLCEAFNIPVIKMPGWEADDVIGTLATRAEKEGFTTYMVTPDKDYGQLVSEKTFIYKPGRGGDVAEVLGVAQIIERWGIERIDQVIDTLGLMGDASDNIPGVPGIGEKTAQKLISRFGSLEGVLEGVGELKGKQKQNVEEYREQALLSKELVTIEVDVPIEEDWQAMLRTGWDTPKMVSLFVELEFSTLGRRLLGENFAELAEGGEVGEPVVLKTLEEVEHDYQLVDTAEKRAALVRELLAQPSFCFDSETTGLDVKRCGLVGLAFSWQEHKGYYVPVSGVRDKALALLDEFRPVFESESEKIGHNLKYDLGVLRWHGVEVKGPFFDTMLATALVEPEGRRGMDHLAQTLLDYKPISISELIGEKGDEQLSMQLVPLDQVVEYAVEDADITWQLAGILREKIEEVGQHRVFYEIECPLLPVLVEMEYEGIHMETGVLEGLSVLFQKEIEHTAARIYELAGEEFNLNSGQQLGALLFDKLELDPNARRTQKTGQYQTSEQVLRRLANRHEIAQRVLDYRLHTKLKSTYLDMLPRTVFKGSGRVHTHYEQAMTATGRMQSHGPNLQTIPVRSEQGREIRRAFVARDENYVLLSADYSQIELRIAAEISGDEGMLQTFREGGGYTLDYGDEDLRRRCDRRHGRYAPPGQNGQLWHHLRHLSLWFSRAPRYQSLRSGRAHKTIFRAVSGRGELRRGNGRIRA